MIEWSVSRSWRPKNIWIRICNTVIRFWLLLPCKIGMFSACKECLDVTQEKCDSFSGLQETNFLSATQNASGCWYFLLTVNELPARKQNMIVYKCRKQELHAMQKMPDCFHAEIKCAGNAGVLSRKCCSKVDRGGNLVTRGLYFDHNGLVERFF